MEECAGASIRTPLSNSPLLPFLLLSLARQKNSPDTTRWIYDEYDYIVVGGGTAGSIIASRLSDISCSNVLLLEAGSDPPLLTEVPALWRNFLGTYVDWNFKLVPQKHTAYGVKNRTLLLHAGKMFGGSSSLNEMVYVRGNRKNYDDWVKQGAKGWSFDEVFPYFLKSEDNRNDSFLENGYHAVGGPITIESSHYVPELDHMFHKAATGLGYKFVDSNGPRQTGFSLPQLNTRDAQRCSTAKAFLVPADDRSNLHIKSNAMVTQVIIEHGRAIGVRFYRKGKYKIVKARREVIVSAGAANTPKLLMLSGIGPREELEKFNIKVNADLPVGKNLQEQGFTSYFFTLDGRHSTLKKLSHSSYIQEYIQNRTGPLSTPHAPVKGFLNGLKINPKEDFPTFDLFVQEAHVGLEKKRLKPEVYKQLFGSIDDDLAIYGCFVANLQPHSRGTVTLKSKNPFDYPAIDPNYLHDPRDVKAFVDGITVCRELLNSEPLKRAGAKPVENLIPGCEKYTSSEQNYYSCYVRYVFSSDLHLAGSCKMGNPNNPNTVVDPKLRVKHIKNLRIADASVMPTVPSGNTMVPTIMIAEKASDIIKAANDCWQ